LAFEGIVGRRQTLFGDAEPFLVPQVNRLEVDRGTVYVVAVSFNVIKSRRS